MGFVGIFASIFGAKYCIGKDRAKIVSNMGILCFFGSIFTAVSFLFSFWLALFMLFLYNSLIIFDSGSLTTGTVVNGEPHDRGVRLALHSMVGFLGTLIGSFFLGGKKFGVLESEIIGLVGGVMAPILLVLVVLLILDPVSFAF